MYRRNDCNFELAALSSLLSLFYDTLGSRRAGAGIPAGLCSCAKSFFLVFLLLVFYSSFFTESGKFTLQLEKSVREIAVSSPRSGLDHPL
jgi:hypothetical protein